MNLLLIGYLILQVWTAVASYYLFKMLKIRTRFQLFLASLAICVTTTLTNVGPVGLILGWPSIVISCILISIVLHRKEGS